MFDVCVRDLSFQGHRWTQTKASAKHLASAEFLEYFGFECPFKEKFAPVMKKKINFKKKSEVKQVLNDLKGKLSQMHRKSREQNTDKREVESISSHNCTDLRLILDMKRNKKESPSSTKSSLFFVDPHEAGLI